MPTMTTSPDHNHGDGDTLMTTTEASSSKTSSPESNDASTTSVNSFSIKIEFKTTSHAFPAPEIHRNIILAIEHQFPSTKINTNSNPNASITASKHNSEFFLRNFNYPSFPRSKFSLVCLAHDITTPASFSQINAATKKILSQNKAFLRINQWKVNELNIVNIGWIYGAHPHAHNRNHISKMITEFCEKNQKPVPSLKIFAKSLSSASSPRKRITTKAIQFACRKEDSDEIKSVLQECFSDSNTFLPGKFIPSDLSYKQGQAIYSQYIQHQNKYLANHRSISVVGVQPTDLFDNIVHNNNNTTLVQQVQQSKLIDWISTTHRTTSEGRFLFSTDKDRYQEAIQWIDQTFLPLFNNLPSKKSSSHPNNILPTRIGTIPKQDSYSQSLASSINSIAEKSYVRPPNAWSKPISIIASSTPQTSVSHMTMSSDQSSIITKMEKQINSLTKTVQDLQNKLEASHQTQKDSIASAIEKAFDTHQQKLEHQYQEMIRSVNDHWKQVTASLPTLVCQPDTTKQIIHSTPPTTPPRNYDDKRSREIHQSGSTRARKPRRFSSGGLESVQRSITHFLSHPPDTNDNTSQSHPDETTMRDE